MGKDGKDAKRITATLTKELDARVGRLAKEHGVTKAWVVRHAVELFFREYIDQGLLRLPLK